MNIGQLLHLREASNVRRFHTRRLRDQTLADHSWGVAMLLLYVQPSASAYQLAAALVHDLPEYETGDLPAPVKWGNPALETELKRIEDKFKIDNDIMFLLTNEERVLLKWCDTMELALRCCEEINTGNKYAQEVLNNSLNALYTYPITSDRTSGLLSYVESFRRNTWQSNK